MDDLLAEENHQFPLAWHVAGIFQHFYGVEDFPALAPYVLNGTNIYVLIIYLPRTLQKIPKNAFSFHGNDRPVEAYEKYKNYVQWAWESEFNDRVCWLNGHVAFYNPELINELGGGIYLGGPIDDLPGKFKKICSIWIFICITSWNQGN